MRPRWRLLTALLAGMLATILLGACSGGGKSTRADEPTRSPNPTAGSVSYAAELGGLDKLVAAAKHEGALNVIGLPAEWANYGELLTRFEAKYGIAVQSGEPQASSRQALAAATRLRGTSSAPDVFDLSASEAAASLTRFAAYKVTTWGDIPNAAKESSGRYIGGYGGVMSIGYDAKRVPAPRSVADLLKPAYRGKVALNGDPTRANAAFFAVVMAALGNGGSAEVIGPGVDFFARLRQDGNLTTSTPTVPTITDGQTPLVVDWDYANVQRATALPRAVDWQVVIPQPAAVGSYSVQAISVDAPHPAAARLWQEFLYSDEGQNLWLRSAVRPVRLEAMQRSGTVDTVAYGLLPPLPRSPVLPTPEQVATSKADLAAKWAAAFG